MTKQGRCSSVTASTSASVLTSTAVSLAKVDTELSADCIEFCPIEGHHDVFVCGTYQVLPPKPKSDKADADSDEDETPKPTERTGRLLLYRIGDDRSSLSVPSSCLWGVGRGADRFRCELQRIETPAILDAKWYAIRSEH